jgi:CubicO group peptidase (beta-lactamase class C family)
VYSNTGFEMLAAHIATQVEMNFDEYLFEAVFAPLDMSSSELLGSPAADIHSTISDLAKFAAELRTPKLLARSTYIEATTPQFGELEGVVPGVGRFAHGVSVQKSTAPSRRTGWPPETVHQPLDTSVVAERLFG